MKLFTITLLVAVASTNLWARGDQGHSVARELQPVHKAQAQKNQDRVPTDESAEFAEEKKEYKLENKEFEVRVPSERK